MKLVLMHANVWEAETKRSRSVPATSVVMADDKWGKRRKKEVIISNRRKKK